MTAFSESAETRALVDELTNDHRFQDHFPSMRREEVLRLVEDELKPELRKVPAIAGGGRQTNVLEKFHQLPSSVLRPEQKERVLMIMEEVRSAYMRVNDALPLSEREHGYQMINWKHTRGEFDQVIESARMSNLTAEQMEDAILASLFSDSIKTPSNFMVHNVDGAEAAAEVLCRYFDLSSQQNRSRVKGILSAIKEHQIGPPEFMAKMTKIFVIANFSRREIELSAQEKSALDRISDKLSKPFDPEYLTADLSEIAFSDAEKTLLKHIGIEHWWVPHESSSWYKASRAVIDGDSLINYASPDGWAKIVAVRGPGTNFKDALIADSLASVKTSYHDAYNVISEKARSLARLGLARTELSVERVRQKIDKWLADCNPPRNKDGKIAFWDAPLNYPGQKGFAQEQYDFARRLKHCVVELLREEQGMEPQWQPPELAALSERGVNNLLQHLEFAEHPFVQPENIIVFVNNVKAEFDSWTDLTAQSDLSKATCEAEVQRRREQLQATINNLAGTMFFAHLHLLIVEGSGIKYLYGHGQLELGEQILAGSQRPDISLLFRGMLAGEQDASALLAVTDRDTDRISVLRSYSQATGVEIDHHSIDWYYRVRALDGQLREAIEKGKAPLFNYGRSEALSEALQKRRGNTQAIADSSDRMHETKERFAKLDADPGSANYMLRTEVEADLVQHLVASYLREGDTAFASLIAGRKATADPSSGEPVKAYKTSEQFTPSPEILQSDSEK